MLRTILAILAGVAVAMLVISGMHAINHQFYPLPAGLDWANKEAVAAYARSMPMEAMLLVVVGWCLGAFAGAAVPAWQANHRRPAALAVGLTIAGATWLNSTMIPQPIWMTASGIAGSILLSWLATILVKARKTPRPPPGKWPDSAIRR